jgi:acyl-coenzyme A synthetase/AMP-(fatty) acid ligase
MASPPPPRPVLLPAAAPARLRRNDGHVFVVGPGRAEQLAAAELLLAACEADAPLALAADDPRATLPAAPREPGLVFFTSGTSGKPQPVHRPWTALTAETSAHGGADDRLLLTFNLARYAGLQVLFHCRRHGSRLIVSESVRDGAAIIAAGAAEDATHLSTTPSLLKRLVTLGAAERLDGLRQITIGGEYATQATLDLARRCWPAARVTAIYASSEGGACFSVSDGREGFPAAMLRNGRDGRVGELAEDGELVVALPDGRVLRTGDFFERAGDRVLFRGRREDIINVGGYKVSPVKVERVILGVAGVEECRVVGRPSPVLGEVVTAEIVGDFDQVAVRDACRSALERPEVPVALRRVQRLELSAAQKLSRAGAAA